MHITIGGGKLVGTPGHSSNRHRRPVSPRSAPSSSCGQLFCSLATVFSLPPTLSSYAAEFGDRGAQQHSTSPRFPAVPLCGLPCMVIVITADLTLLETMPIEAQWLYRCL